MCIRDSNKRGQIAQSLKDIENRENARNKISLEQRIGLSLIHI